MEMKMISDHSAVKIRENKNDAAAWSDKTTLDEMMDAVPGNSYQIWTRASLRSVCGATWHC